MKKYFIAFILTFPAIFLIASANQSHQEKIAAFNKQQVIEQNKQNIYSKNYVSLMQINGAKLEDYEQERINKLNSLEDIRQELVKINADRLDHWNNLLEGDSDRVYQNLVCETYTSSLNCIKHKNTNKSELSDIPLPMSGSKNRIHNQEKLYKQTLQELNNWKPEN